MILEKIMDIFKGGGGAFYVITLSSTFLAHRMTQAADSGKVVFWTSAGQEQFSPDVVKGIETVSIKDLLQRIGYLEKELDFVGKNRRIACEKLKVKGNKLGAVREGLHAVRDMLA